MRRQVVLASVVRKLGKIMSMKKITGLGGVFIKAKDPKALAKWYEDVLGINFNNNTYVDLPFTDEAGKITPGSNVLSFFKEDTAYFNPSEKQVMLNLRVQDLLALIEELKNNGTPIVLWVYLGLRKTGSGNSVYTYGLTEFGKQEMEVINSKMDLEELFDFVGNICTYVIENDITFNSGETLGYTAEQKIKITSSKGQFVDGHSLKLEM